MMVSYPLGPSCVYCCTEGLLQFGAAWDFLALHNTKASMTVTIHALAFVLIEGRVGGTNFIFVVQLI